MPQVSSADIKSALSVLPKKGWHEAELREVLESDRGTVRLRFSIVGDDDSDIGKSVTLSVTPAVAGQSPGSQQHLIRAAYALGLLGGEGGELPAAVDDFKPFIGRRCRLHVVHESAQGGQVFARVGHGGIERS